ncbi:MAG: hypothetical protein NC211_02890 [Alistipes senegalensis]|nr:hypothetical protein [Oxalobacter formigenes]MCM1280768.1 hypothetical protein [Alistipes senegalensis]
MKIPILSGMMQFNSESEGTGGLCHTTGQCGLSHAEIANHDKAYICFADLTFYDDGLPTREAVAKFVSMMPVSEQDCLLLKGGPTQLAACRLQNAVFARVYNDDVVLEALQSYHHLARRIMTGLSCAAPEMAELEGTQACDIREILVSATRRALSAAANGRSLPDAIRQADFFTDGIQNQAENAIIEMFAGSIHSGNAIAEKLRRLAIRLKEEAKKENTAPAGSVGEAAQQTAKYTMTAGQKQYWAKYGGDLLRAIFANDASYDFGSFFAGLNKAV